MSNQPKPLIAGRWLAMTGEAEYTSPVIPPGATENFYRRPIDRETAQRHFDLGNAIYVNGLRMVKA